MGSWFSQLWDAVVQFFSSIANYFINFIYDIWSWVYDFFVFIAECICLIFNSILAFPFYILDFVLVSSVKFIKLIIGDGGIYGHMELNQAPSLPFQITNFFTQLNYFLPMTEICISGGIYLTFCFFWFLYKFIKSWIPTVST